MGISDDIPLSAVLETSSTQDTIDLKNKIPTLSDLEPPYRSRYASQGLPPRSPLRACPPTVSEKYTCASPLTLSPADPTKGNIGPPGNWEFRLRQGQDSQMMTGPQTEGQAGSGWSWSLGEIRGGWRCWGAEGHEGQQGMLVGSEVKRMEKVPSDPPLRTALTVSPATQAFKGQVTPVTFKLLPSSDKRWCGPKRDEDGKLDSEPPVSAVSHSADSRPCMFLRLSIVP